MMQPNDEAAKQRGGLFASKNPIRFGDESLGRSNRSLANQEKLLDFALEFE